MVGSEEVTHWDGTLVLSTRRLKLRTFVIDDLPDYAELNADLEVMKYLGRPLDRAHSDEIAGHAQQSLAESGIGKIAIERTSDGIFLGMCGLSMRSGIHTILNLGGG